jgi:diguanylate cyclase (GGDEF)-like protein
MHQLAVVSAPSEWPAGWRLRDFQVHHHTALKGLAADLRFDCIVLVEPRPEEVASVLRGLKERDRQGAVALLVAGRATSGQMHLLLDQFPCDGFLDLSWPEPLAAAGLRIALSHVELGRNMVEIQRVVIEQTRQQMTSLYDLANHDGLTNLFNLRYFADLMERQHEQSKREGQAYALVFIDLDDLKRLNTQYGHAGGSLALNELARTIASTIRGSDVAVRLGGDEFAVFLADCDQSQATELAWRLCSRVREHQFEVDGQKISLTISCGVSAYPEDGLFYTDLLKYADAALLHAKASGKNRVVSYARSLQPPLAH